MFGTFVAYSSWYFEFHSVCAILTYVAKDLYFVSGLLFLLEVSGTHFFLIQVCRPLCFSFFFGCSHFHEVATRGDHICVRMFIVFILRFMNMASCSGSSGYSIWRLCLQCSTIWPRRLHRYVCSGSDQQVVCFESLTDSELLVCLFCF